MESRPFLCRTWQGKAPHSHSRSKTFGVFLGSWPCRRCYSCHQPRSRLPGRMNIQGAHALIVYVRVRACACVCRLSFWRDTAEGLHVPTWDTALTGCLYWKAAAATAARALASQTRVAGEIPITCEVPILGTLQASQQPGAVTASKKTRTGRMF